MINKRKITNLLFAMIILVMTVISAKAEIKFDYIKVGTTYNNILLQQNFIITSFESKDKIPGISIAFGKYIDKHLRIESEISYITGFKNSISTPPLEPKQIPEESKQIPEESKQIPEESKQIPEKFLKLKMSSLKFMLNGYFDIPEIQQYIYGLKPYIIGGIGFSLNYVSRKLNDAAFKNIVEDFLYNFSYKGNNKYAKKNSIDITTQIGFGLSYNINKNLYIDVDYKYVFPFFNTETGLDALENFRIKNSLIQLAVRKSF